MATPSSLQFQQQQTYCPRYGSGYVYYVVRNEGWVETNKATFEPQTDLEV